ncbi:MAG: hypothetical protein PHO86_05120, partial [Bacilli bacterium]|nr:hypothetical protein [Bacilli bacterium]
KLLNEIDIDISYSGHEHELIPIIPGTFTPYENLIYKNTKYTTKSSVNEGYFTDAQFPTFIVSKHDDVQNIDRTQSQLDGKMCGVASHVDASFTKLTLCYTNRYLEKMEMVDPFSAIEYGTEIIINLE